MLNSDIEQPSTIIKIPTRTKCVVEDCYNTSGLAGTAKGLCSSHYHRLLRYGDITATPRKIQAYKGETCAEDKCIKPTKSAGMCVNHYAVAHRARTKKQDPEGYRSRAGKFRATIIAKREHLLGRPRPSTCEICHESEYEQGNKPRVRICFDHDHKTGKARGWICDRCNKVLGLVKDNITLMTDLILYLKEHSGETHN